MPRWNLEVSEETDLAVRRYLARTGDMQGHLSKFVDDTVRREVLRRILREIQEKSQGLSAEKAEALAYKAVAWVPCES